MRLIDLLYLPMIIGMITCDDNGVVRLVVRVGEDVVLPCSLSPEKNIEPDLFDWTKGRQDVFLYNAGIYQSEDLQFRGRVSHFPDKLKNGNASIVIRNIQLSDSGNYSCFFPRLQQQRFHIELFVGAPAKPRVMILDITKDRALLQCEIRGAFPKPQISWIDGNGRVLPAKEKLEDSEDLHCPPALTLQTNVTKTGSFRCVVAQQELNHTTEVQISIPISSDKTATGSNGVLLSVILGSLIVALLCLNATLILFWMHRRRAMRGERLDAINSRKAERPALADEKRKCHLPHHTSHLLERHDSGVSSIHLSYHPAERCDSGVSSLHSSYHPAKAQETRESKLKAEPDEALKNPLQEF